MNTTTHVPLGQSGIALSRIVLGGHEYLPDGRSRAFNEDLAKAVTPGHVFDGFGGPQRQALLAHAFSLGIDAFDVTIDSEKEALGRNLIALGNPAAIMQTRPEGMLYSYDPGNRKLVTPGLLEAEVRRILMLTGRVQIDILNIGILATALQQDADYIARLSEQIALLKQKQLIRCAAADSFSGAVTYLAMIAGGAFDSLNINFNLADDAAADEVLPAARAAGTTVVAREIFIKGALFNVGRELGIEAPAVARAGLLWAAQRRDVDALIVGAQDIGQFDASVRQIRQVQQAGTGTDEDMKTLQQLSDSDALRALRLRNRDAFHGVANQ